MLVRFASLVVLVSCVCACGESTPPAREDGGVDPALLYPDGCDPIVRGACGYPFPSDVWTVPDETSVTGLHLELPPAFVPAASAPTDTRIFRAHDGFSANGAIMTYLEGATAVGLPDCAHIEDSLAQGSPTVLMDAETGERIAHFAELDVRSARGVPTGVLLLQPAARLRDATRYVVAIRNVRDASGALLSSTPAFQGLRDGVALGDPRFEARRARYASIMATLTANGVPADSLQVAWEFTTASEHTNTSRLLAMRDSALADLGESPAAYEVTSVTYDVDDHIAIHMEGTIDVPDFLDATGFMVLDANGAPVRTGVRKARFFLEVPYAARTEARPVVQYGHFAHPGEQIFVPELRALADTYGFVLFATDWLGYRDADTNLPSFVFTSGDLSRFRIMPDMNQQAVLNHVVTLRTALRGLVSDARTFLDGSPTIASTGATYFGISQGGILGSTYVALSPDVERAVIASAGHSYTLMLPRTSVYSVFLAYWNSYYFVPKSYPLFLGMLQLMWDRVDPASFGHKVLTNRFPGARAKEVLVIHARGDSVSPTVSGHFMARSFGVPNVTPAVHTIFGVPDREAPYEGSGFFEVAFPTPVEPITNEPASYVAGRHLTTWSLPPVAQAVGVFLRDGMVTNPCTGPCDPE